jgi:hypothetical protein
VSIAQIDAAGPFSDFAAYRRYMILLRGGGVRLSFSSRDPAQGVPEPRELRAVGDSVQFDGALATYCELVDGPCVDFNLMVSKRLPEPKVRVVVPGASLSTGLAGGESMLVFPIGGRVQVESGDAREVLDPWDLALVTGKTPRDVRVAAAAALKVVLAVLPAGLY